MDASSVWQFGALHRLVENALGKRNPLVAWLRELAASFLVSAR